MARFVVGVVAGIVITTLAGAALSLHADDEVEAAALEAGVDPTDLAGAVNSSGVGPREYLVGVGELAGSRSTPPAPIPVVWATLAGCESAGNWRANTGNGFYGGLQFDRSTWLAYGGGTYASAAYLASPVQQVAVAERLRAARGFAPWPACSRRLGLIR